MDEAAAAQVIEQMSESRPFGTRLYALLDAARNPRIWPALRDADEQHVCLFAGKLDPALVEVAPYIVALEPEAKFTQWIVQHGWGDSWGIWCAAPIDLEEIRNHFRKFTMVRDEDQKNLYFRFYDPRVWRDYMSIADDSDRGQLFGPVDCFWCEDKSPQVMLHFRRDNSGAVKTQQLAVTAGAAS